MATKNNRRTIITKKILKETLMGLMMEKPISKITIKEICDLSEMSRSTFYLHYTDQFELLEDIEKEIIEKTFDNLSNLDSELNSIESIEFFLQYVKDNRNAFKILLCQSENQLFQEAIMKNVQQYVQSIVPRLTDETHEKYIYSFIMHGSLSVIIDWMNSNFETSVTDIAKLIFHSCNNILHGND